MELILVHGLGQRAESWDQTKGHLKESAHVHCPELYSGTDNEDISYQKLYEQLEEYCTQFNEPIALCGISLGGILSLNYAIEHGDQVQKLILIGTPYKIPRLLFALQYFVFQCLPRQAFLNFGLSKSNIIQLCGSMLHLDFSNRLVSVIPDTLVICGQKDLTNLLASQQLSRKIRSANLITIPGSGHEVNKDQPQKLAQVLDEFLRNDC